MEISVGSMEPLEKAKRPPARPAAAPATDEGEPAVRAHVDADGVGARRRIARSAQRVAERRMDPAPQQHDGRRAHDERQVVVGLRGRRPSATATRRPRRCRRPSPPPTGRRRRRRSARRRASAWRGRCPSGARRRSRTRPHRAPAISGAATSAGSIGSPSLVDAEPRAIGAEAEIGGMAEADDAADADQEVQAEGGQREAQNLDRHLDRGRRRRRAAARADHDHCRDGDVLGAPEALQP